MSNKITILHLVSSSAFLGAERVVCELASSADSKYAVKIGLLGSPKSVFESFKKILEVTSVELIYIACDGKISLTSIKTIINTIKSNDVNILHSHGYKSDCYAYLSCLFSSMSIKLIATNHTWKLRNFSDQLYKYIDKTILKAFDAIAAVSEEVKEEMVRLGITGNRITIIYNGISLDGYDISDRSSVRRGMGIAEHELVVGCVASLTTEKAHGDLLRAFAFLYAKIPHARLVLIGDGPERSQLSVLSESLGISNRVIFTGQRSDVKSLYAVFDFFALVSYAEGLPMAMLESMAASLPVVVSSVGAIPQVITHMKNGILVTPGSVSEICSAFVTLANDLDLRKTLGRNARKQVMANYSVERMAKDYEELYDKVLGSGK